MYLDVLISDTSVHDDPMYCSTASPAGFDPATKPESADVPNPDPPYLAVFKFVPEAQAPVPCAT